MSSRLEGTVTSAVLVPLLLLAVFVVASHPVAVFGGASMASVAVTLATH
jgi:uncharacterized membrane protein